MTDEEYEEIVSRSNALEHLGIRTTVYVQRDREEGVGWDGGDDTRLLVSPADFLDLRRRLNRDRRFR